MVRIPTREQVVADLDDIFVRYEEKIAEGLTLVMFETTEIAMQLTGGSVALVLVLVVVCLGAHATLRRLNPSS